MENSGIKRDFGLLTSGFNYAVFHYSLLNIKFHKYIYIYTYIYTYIYILQICAWDVKRQRDLKRQTLDKMAKTNGTFLWVFHGNFTMKNRSLTSKGIQREYDGDTGIQQVLHPSQVCFFSHGGFYWDEPPRNSPRTSSIHSIRKSCGITSILLKETRNGSLESLRGGWA